jgi:hypothetical protein
MLDAEAAANRGFDGLHGWMKKAEKTWNANKRSDMKLVELFDYFAQLSSQFPLAPLRVVYAKSGTNPAACVLRGGLAVIENKLYWSALRIEAETYYITALLNSETTRSRSEAFQSRGQWGARDFDKVIFNLPIPRFDLSDPLHNAIAGAAREAEVIAASLLLPGNIKFQRARGLVRAALTEGGVAHRIDALVATLLDGV